MKKPIHRHLEPHRFAPHPFNKEGCAFWYSYYVRPWELARDLWFESRSVLHRGIYGWAVEDTWSLDRHLSVILPQMLRRLKEDAYGIPTWCFSPDDPELDNVDKARENWQAWLEAKAKALESFIELLDEIAYEDDPRWQAFYDEMGDFWKYFASLWD
jgi:hypothetical protein